jgi:hypothetical protein
VENKGDRHPAKLSKRESRRFAVSSANGLLIPEGKREAEVGSGGRKVRLTNLEKEFWPSEWCRGRIFLSEASANSSPAVDPDLLNSALFR